MKSNGASVVIDREETSEPASGEDMTVQQAVLLTGLGVHTLRYYERQGLLGSVRRDRSSGHRRYSAEDVARLETLSCLRAVGMSLEEMRQYLAILPEGAAAAGRQIGLLRERQAALREQLSQTQRHLDYIDHKIDYWNAVERGDDAAIDEIGGRLSLPLE